MLGIGKFGKIWVNKINPEKKISEETACGENVRQYLLATSLHGLKYIGLKNITFFER